MRKKDVIVKVCFINPPFKAEYGKFSRESRSPAIGHSGVLYYPLWLIYAAAVCEKDGFEVEFLDAPAKPMDKREQYEYIQKHAEGTKLFVVNTSTPSIVSDTRCADYLKKLYPSAFVMLVGTHPSALPEETLKNVRRAVDAFVQEAEQFDDMTMLCLLYRGPGRKN